MAPRASWKGFLNLSLVSVPVKAYSSSNSGGQIQLNQLCSKCHSRIRQKTVCPVHGELDRSEILKGYEYAKDQYVVIDLDELDRLRAEDEGKAIKIDAFVAPDQLDPIYFSESSYYLLPDGAAGQKPYALLHRAMLEKGLYCIAKLVLHSKEQLVLIRAIDDVLCMTTLRYAHQIKSTSAFADERAETSISEAEYALANTLIDETTASEFDLAAYHDEYTQRLTQLIDAKVTGKEIVAAPAAEAPSVINLMEALKASVAKAQEAKVPAASAEGSAGAAPGAKRKAVKKSDSALAKALSSPAKEKKGSARKKRTG
jgi:DNA end-binding protein Ku